MKKRIPLLLSALLLAGGAISLGACSDGKIHVKFWHTMGKANMELLDRMIAELLKSILM